MRLPLFRTLVNTTLRIACCVFFVHFSFCSFSTVYPSNGAVLNFTQVMFEYDEVPSATHYIIYIVPTDATGVSDQSAVRKIKNPSLACIVSDLQFGKSYKWHYEALKKKKTIFKSEDYSFSIMPYYFVDTAFFRNHIEVSKKKGGYNGIIFLDYTGVAIDRQGRAIWYYPFKLQDGAAAPNFRNMRMTADGSITFQDNTDCYEVDIKGNRLWKAPNDGKISGAATEFYHHDFRKLDDGTYLTSSYKFENEPNYYKPSITSKVRYNTLIQYDASGKIIWHWNEKDHVSKAVIFQGYNATATDIEGTHLNGFDYDPTEDAIVMSFRNNSSIIKIDKKTGRVIYTLADYGAQSGKQNHPWFARQHGPVILPGHRLLIYNNNVTDTIKKNPNPVVMIVKEPFNGKDASIEWEYECRSDRYPNGIIGKEGYAVPLPNGNILVCMGGANYTFEVTLAGEIVWQCSFERFDDKKNTWTGFTNYRSNYASSLYPKYFTLQLAGEKSIRINNEGTEKDTYIAELLSGDGRTKVFTDTVSINERSSATIKLPVPAALSQNQQKTGLVVVVSPISNRLSQRILNLAPHDKK